MKNTWKYHGRLNNGEAVFIQEDGRIAIEKDQRHLVDARPTELYEVFQKWPVLIDEVTQGKDVFMEIRQDKNLWLKDRVIALELEAQERRSVIVALKYANDERDKMIASLMEDVAAGKAKIKDLMFHINWFRADVHL